MHDRPTKGGSVCKGGRARRDDMQLQKNTIYRELRGNEQMREMSEE